jgi:hypothetical protein
MEQLQTNLKIASKSLKIASKSLRTVLTDTNHLLKYAAKRCVNTTFLCEHHIPCVITCCVNTTRGRVNTSP